MKQKERKNTMDILKILIVILFIINVGQAFCEKNHNLVSKDLMSGIDENDDDPALMHPLEMFFPGLTIQDFQPEEIPAAVNEQAVLPAQAPIIEQQEQEQEVENVLEIYLGSLEGTDTGLLVQAVQTGDMRPYVSFFKGETKHRVNRFLDQVFPGDDQISFMAFNGWSKGDFKSSLNNVIDTATFDVVAPTGYQMRDLMRTEDKLNTELYDSLKIFLDSIVPYGMDMLDSSVVIDQEALSVIGISDIRSSDDFFSALLIGTEESSFHGDAEVGLVPVSTLFPQDIFAGTDTGLLFQAMQTGDMQPYVDHFKEQLKSRINQFLDQLAPGDNQVNLINPEITSYLLSDQTKDAFKAAINETINAAVVQVAAPTGYRVEDLRRANSKISDTLSDSMGYFLNAIAPDYVNIINPDIIIDQSVLAEVNIHRDIRTSYDLLIAFLGFFE